MFFSDGIPGSCFPGLQVRIRGRCGRLPLNLYVRFTAGARPVPVQSSRNCTDYSEHSENRCHKAVFLILHKSSPTLLFRPSLSGFYIVLLYRAPLLYFFTERLYGVSYRTLLKVLLRCFLIKQL